jgi:hypothetical protein
MGKYQMVNIPGIRLKALFNSARGNALGIKSE